MKKIQKISGFIAAALFLIFAILLIIMLGLKIIGNSPSHTEILYTITGTIASYLYFLNQRVSLFIGEMREFKETTIRSFDRIRDDMNTLKEDVNEKFDDIKKELKLIAEKIK